jgi:hypothetical protein
VLLDGVSMQYNFVNVFLYIFADAIQSLLHVDGSGMLTLLLAFVTCSCASAASAVLRALLPGLEVLMQAATTANVNLALAVVQDNCPLPLAHVLFRTPGSWGDASQPQFLASSPAIALDYGAQPGLGAGDPGADTRNKGQKKHDARRPVDHRRVGAQPSVIKSRCQEAQHQSEQDVDEVLFEE